MDNQCEELPPRLLTGKRLWGYSMGIFGQFLPSTLITAYLSIFYIYTIGLDAVLVGIGTALGAILNALFAPIFGYISDNHKPGKWGKRRPFLLLGLPILLTAFILLWLPPTPTPGDRWNMGVALYLWVFMAAFFINFSLIRANYTAMLTEQSQVEKNRIKISTLQGVFSIGAAILGVLLPMIIQSRLNNPQDMYYTTADGQYLMDILVWIATGFGLLSLIFIMFTVFSVDESFYLTDPRYTACLSQEKKAIKERFMGLFSPFKDIDYRIFLFSSISLNISMRMMVRILAPFLTFVLLMQGNEFVLFTVGIIPFAVLGFVFWQKKAKEIGLKRTFLISTSMMAGILVSTVILLIPMEKYVRLFLAFAMISAVLYCMTSGYIVPNPTISRLVDSAPPLANEIQGQGNKSGVYFGSYLFSLNISNALADIIMGAVMTGENAVNPVILTLIFPLSSLFFLIAVFFFRRINLDRK